MLSRDARYVAAGVQGIIAWEWLVSGANKVLSGTFPQGLADTLSAGLKNNPNGWYVALLQNVVVPHGVGFGYAIELTELLIGIALLIGVALLLGPVRHRGDPQHRLAVGEMSFAALAALACAFLCINFHFFMGDGIFPGLDTARAFDEGISLDTLMPPLSVLILYINIHVLCDMTGVPLTDRLRRAKRRARLLFVGAGQQKSSGVAENA
jgi:thiosulfate dehydrogenase (quinone) large subunit